MYGAIDQQEIVVRWKSSLWCK